MLYCFREKGDMGLYCTEENASSAVPSLLVNVMKVGNLISSSEIWKTIWILLSVENYRFY